MGCRSFYPVAFLVLTFGGGSALAQEVPAASEGSEGSPAVTWTTDTPAPEAAAPATEEGMVPPPPAAEAGEAAPVAPPPPEVAVLETLQSGSWSMTLPLGIQASAAHWNAENPITEEKIALGRMLFFDVRLSRDSSVSCASCHNPFHGFAAPDRTSQGVAGQRGTRNSPTVINRLFSSEHFWDGRAASLEEVIRTQLTSPNELGMPSSIALIQRMKGIKSYIPLFTAAFGDDTIDIDRTVKAIAAFSRTIVSGNSPFDRFQAGDNGALNVSALRGMELFNGKGNCKTCHTGPNFTDEAFHNLGVGMNQSKPDLGRYLATKKDPDIGRFKTPTLRNVLLSAPYMHDGSRDTLLGVVELYDKGGISNPRLDPEIKPLNLSDQEKRDLVSFLEALTGDTTSAVPPEELPQ